MTNSRPDVVAPGSLPSSEAKGELPSLTDAFTADKAAPLRGRHPRDARADRTWQALARVVAAHIAELAATGLLDDDSAATATDGLAQVIAAGDAPATLTAQLAALDERLDRAVSLELAAAARVARSPFDTGSAVLRIVARDLIDDLDLTVAAWETAVLDLAQAHVVTLMPLTADAATVQPTTVAHWLGPVIGATARARVALAAARAETNRSPLGAGAGAGVGFEIDRGALARRLDFDGPVDNTLDAVVSVDWLVAIGQAASRLLQPAVMLLDELLIWRRTDPFAIRLDDQGLANAAGIPQWSGATGLVETLAKIRSALRMAETLGEVAHHQPYAPSLARLDDFAGRIQRTIFAAVEALTACRELLGHIDINRAYLANRSGRGFSTSSDLAIFLMLEEQIDPSSAERIAAMTVARAREQGVEASGITQDLIDAAAMLVLGRELKVEFEAISRYLAPRRFVERRALQGGPAPAETRAYLDRARKAVKGGGMKEEG